MLKHHQNTINNRKGIIYSQIQPYRRYWKENTNQRRLTTDIKTQAIKKSQTNKTQIRKTHTHTHHLPQKITGISNHWAFISPNIQ